MGNDAYPEPGLSQNLADHRSADKGAVNIAVAGHQDDVVRSPLDGARWIGGRVLERELRRAAPAGADPVLRSAQDQPRFGRAERLYVELQAYNPKRDATGAGDLVCQAAVLRGGAVLATAAPEGIEADSSAGPLPHLSRIGLRPFEPGDYELRVTVTDRKANATASRAVPFTVE